MRPLAAAAPVAGAPPTLGRAPDIGAYEFGDSVYWMPGRRAYLLWLYLLWLFSLWRQRPLDAGQACLLTMAVYLLWLYLQSQASLLTIAVYLLWQYQQQQLQHQQQLGIVVVDAATYLLWLTTLLDAGQAASYYGSLLTMPVLTMADHPTGCGAGS